MIPPVYSQAFRRGLTGVASVEEQRIPAAGHVLLAEQQEAVIDAMVNFCED